MDPKIVEKERSIEKLKLENEEASERVSLEEKKALIKDAKAKYGRDWKKVLGIVGKGIKGLRPDMDTVHDLYGSGLGDLKEASKLPYMRRRQ